MMAPPTGESPSVPLPASAGPVIEIVLPDSCRLRVGAGFDEVTLVRVLAVLEGRPC